MSEKGDKMLTDFLQLLNNIFEFYKSNEESLSSEAKCFLFFAIIVAAITVSVSIGYSTRSSFKRREKQHEKGILHAYSIILYLALPTTKKI